MQGTQPLKDWGQAHEDLQVHIPDVFLQSLMRTDALLVLGPTSALSFIDLAHSVEEFLERFSCKYFTQH